MAMLVLSALCGVGALGLLAVPGMRFSAFLLLCAALFFALLALLGRLAQKRRWARTARAVLLGLFGAGLLCFAVLEARIVADARGDADDQPIACLIVLGAGVNGTEPSLMLYVRLQAALACLTEHPELPVVVSGCQGQGEDITEAECMYRWLVAHGVDESRIWKEERATSTRTNFAYSIALMAEHGVDPSDGFAFVTNDFHICRARAIAGIPWARGVAAHLPRSLYFDALEVNYFVREAFALANEFLFRMDLDL